MSSEATSHLPPIPDELGPLNPAQAEAVQHLDGPLLILAGAGSGKTRVLTRRIAYMLHVGVDPEQILAVTFTNKAATEMKERVEELVGSHARKVWVSTFHSSCARILRSEAEALGYTLRFAIYDDDDQMRMLRQIVADQGYDAKKFPPASFLQQIDHYKNRMLSARDVVDQKRRRSSDPLVRVWDAYEDSLRAADAMDFNDLIGKAVQLFRDHPDILAKYREKFRYVLVDEYQDTNRAQYQLLRALTLEHRNLAVVGDDDQSIYGFRGADIRNILDFEQDFPDARIVRLEQNYRCTEKILTVANAVVSKNADRIVKELYTETKRGGARVSFQVHDDARAEADSVAHAVQQLRRRGVAPGDIAVIYRTNATSQPFEMAFREHGIPYKVVGGRKFYSRREIRDALAFLRLVTNPADDAAFLRVVNVPPRGLGTKTVGELRHVATERGEPLFKAARGMALGADRKAKALAAFVRLIDELHEVAQTASLPAFVQQVLERSGYVTALKAEDTPDSRSRLENLTALLRDAAQFDDGEQEELSRSGPVDVLHAWLDRIALAGADEDIPEGGEVALMTVHTSKGLEYPVVFVVHMNEGQFPHARAAEEPGGVDEERRLAYVAFTRAKDRLVVSRVRMQTGIDPRQNRLRRDPVAASRFLFGLPLDACDGVPPELDEATSTPTEPPPTQPARAPTPSEEEEVGERRRFSALAALRTAAPEGTSRVREAVVRTREEEEAPVRTRDIEEASDLRPGVWVVDERRGRGQIEKLLGNKLVVRFGTRIEIVSPGQGGLQILDL